MKFVYRKSREELEEGLQRQIGHLRESLQGYDRGRVEEAERIASALYVLFFDGTGRTRSLTGMLHIKRRLLFFESALPTNDDPEIIRLGPPMCLVGPKGAYEPKFQYNDELYQLVPFNSWWENAIYKTDNNLNLSRKNLIFALRSQDGGSHVDDVITNEAYHWLSAYGEIGLSSMEGVHVLIYMNPAKYSKDKPTKFVVRTRTDSGDVTIATTKDPPILDKNIPVKNAHWATMRQIGWEADEAFRRSGY